MINTTSLEKNKIRFLLLEGVHASAVETLNAAGYSNIDYVSTALSDEELMERIRGVHFIGIRSRTRLNAKVLAAADKLIGIGCFCIGTNQVDLDAATERGIAVFNAPFSNTRSVAELVIAEAIMLLRGVPEKNARAHRGEWQKSAKNSHEVRGKRLGIIGYGSIGSQLSVIAESLGMEVSFYDVVSKLPIGNANQVGSLEELLACSDVVSLHVPASDNTRNLITARQLACMKEGSILINAARGNVVVIEDLCDALRSGRVLGAAIDVFPTEPKSNDEAFLSPLREFDNVILTPHVGGSTLEAQENIGLEVAGKFVQYSDVGSTITSVNMPEVALPAHPGKHRLLHIHNNIPGVLSSINQIFSESGINISSQYLQTNDKVGYMVMDVDSEQGELAVKQLKQVPGTIRCRIIF